MKLLVQNKKIKEILIGTHNKGKIKEISFLLGKKIKKLTPFELNISVQNFCNFACVVLIDFRMGFVDFDFNFVEHTFGAHEEVTRGRIASPNYSGSTVHLHA